MKRRRRGSIACVFLPSLAGLLLNRPMNHNNTARPQAVEAFGKVDVWVNNAGRGINRSILEVGDPLIDAMMRCARFMEQQRLDRTCTPLSPPQVSDEDWDEMFNVNARSALYGMQTVYPYFTGREVCAGMLTSRAQSESIHYGFGL